MSFSSQVKEELGKISNLSKKDQVVRELMGYLISSNTTKNGKKIKFSTENEYNINRFSKLLKNVNIEKYNIEIKGKIYSVDWKFDLKNDELIVDNDKILFKLNVKNEYLDKALVRGAFLGSGYINNPEKKYHLEINFNQEENCNNMIHILESYGIFAKKIKKRNVYSMYIKEGEEISKLLAFIGANNAVLKFEEHRVIRDTRNNVNRIINCETANLTKTIQAGKKQVEDIKFIKKKNKFGELPDNLKIIAEIRLKNPEASLSELVKILGNTISKSGISHRLSAIAKYASDLRK